MSCHLFRKFDYNAFRMAIHLPKKSQAHYFALNAFFLELLRSREISKETSICQTRLHWWSQTLKDIENDKKAREPVAVMLKKVKQETHVNFNLLHRMVDFQLYDIDRGDIQSIKELEVYAENTRSMMLYMNLHLLGIDCPASTSAASHLGRALGICDVIKKTPYYLAMHRGYLPTDIMLKHNLYFDRIWSKQGGEGIVADEFYDVLLEIAAYAKKHLEVAREIQS